MTLDRMDYLLLDQPVEETYNSDIPQIRDDMQWQTNNPFAEHMAIAPAWDYPTTVVLSTSETPPGNQPLQAQVASITESSTVTPSVVPPGCGKPARRGRRAAHASVERNYRARLNAQVDHLEVALFQSLPSPDMEDLFSNNSRTRHKSQIIDAAADHISELWSRYKLQKEENDDLMFRIQGLHKLADCEDCPVMESARSQAHARHNCQQRCANAPSLG
jgi:hypothetical protein